MMGMDTDLADKTLEKLDFSYNTVSSFFFLIFIFRSIITSLSCLILQFYMRSGERARSVKCLLYKCVDTGLIFFFEPM